LLDASPESQSANFRAVLSKVRQMKQIGDCFGGPARQRQERADRFLDCPCSATP